MYIPKRYGESRIDKCPLCGSQATTINTQKIAVCPKHKTSVLEDLKCVCGEYLETKVGKFGVYFNCLKCGNINLKRALEVNPPKSDAGHDNRASGPREPATDSRKEKQRPKETIVRSDDPRYFD
jgi:hypothetical protein